MQGLLGKKLGMTQVFDDSGARVAVTVLEVGPNTVVQRKTVEKDGYSALQLGFVERRPSRTSKPRAGHFEKAKVAPKQYLKESRVTPEEAEAHPPGQEITVEIFKEGQQVDVLVKSIDKQQQRISLSIKDALPPAEPEEQDESTKQEKEALPKPSKPRSSKPLRGGLGRSPGGDRFGLNW